MTSLTLELPSELVNQLHQAAERVGEPINILVAQLLAEQLNATTSHASLHPAPIGERESARDALRAAGLWTELGPDAQRLASESNGTLEEVEAAFARAGGKSLSTIVREMREGDR